MLDVTEGDSQAQAQIILGLRLLGADRRRYLEALRAVNASLRERARAARLSGLTLRRIERESGVSNVTIGEWTKGLSRGVDNGQKRKR